jgi:hypothetical protein
MKAITFLLLIIALMSCRQNDSMQVLSTPLGSAESVYLTHDDKENPVVVWTERDNGILTLYFAISSDNGDTFSKPLSLSLSADVATHAEGMPKIAFTRNGLIVAAYEKKSPTASNKYAGTICYRTSADGGRSWEPELFLHSDTIAGRSRSYFDLERLPDGAIGASWLDIKLNNETGGRSVRFAKTDGSQRFGNEILVDSSACQCCRIDVYSDMTGRINVAYRGLTKGVMGQSVRDMMIATSSDNGLSFGTPARISQDNWVIDGCPHTGPSLCSSKGGLYSMWYTEGSGTGLYYSFRQSGNNAFNKRELVSNAGHHPQSSADDTRFVMVWEETLDGSDKKITSIVCQVSRDNDVARKNITKGDSNAYAPVVTPTRDGFLVAFLEEHGNGVRMCTVRL